MASVETRVRYHNPATGKPASKTFKRTADAERFKAKVDGRLDYRVRYRDPAGKQHNPSFDRKTDADRYAREIEHAKDKGNYVNPQLGKTKFGELAERWYATTAGLRPKTLANYRDQLDVHILPRFGQLPIGRIDRLMVSEFVANRTEAGLSPNSIRLVYGVLKQVLDAGVDGGLLAVNLAIGIRLPKKIQYEGHVLTPTEVERLARAIREPYGVLINMAAWSGMRWGELVGLKVGRLDLLARKVHVVEQLVEVHGRFFPGPPKNGKSRIIELLPSLCDELGAYLNDRPHGPDDLVFSARRGGPLHEAHFRSWYFKPAVKEAGLEPLVFHDLRRTADSLMLAESNGDYKWVEAQMGHQTDSMTLAVYGRLLPGRGEKHLERLDRARAAGLEAEAWPDRGPEVIDLSRKAR